MNLQGKELQRHEITTFNAGMNQCAVDSSCQHWIKTIESISTILHASKYIQ